MKLSFRSSRPGCPWAVSAASAISYRCTGSGSLNLNTSFSSSWTRSSGAASSDSEKSPSSISGLGVLGLEVSEEDISSFNQGNCSSTQACSSSATASRSPVVPWDASSVILAAPGVNGGPGVGDYTGGVLGSGVSLRSSSNSESESEAAATGCWGAVCREQLSPGFILELVIQKPLDFSIISGEQ